MSRRVSLLGRLAPRGETGLAKLSVILIVAGAILSGIDLSVSGSLSAPLLALDVIGVTLLPYGLLAMYLSDAQRRPDDPPADDDGFGDGGGGGGWIDERRPLPPSGGLQIDWRRFEADFQAYAESLAHV